MSEAVTKEDLRQFELLLFEKMADVLKKVNYDTIHCIDPEWIKSKTVRKLLDISAGSVQNLRTTGKVRFKKVLGSYYYNKEDLQKLFKDD